MRRVKSAPADIAMLQHKVVRKKDSIPRMAVLPPALLKGEQGGSGFDTHEVRQPIVEFGKGALQNDIQDLFKEAFPDDLLQVSGTAVSHLLCEEENCTIADVQDIATRILCKMVMTYVVHHLVKLIQYFSLRYVDCVKTTLLPQVVSHAHDALAFMCLT